MPPATVGGQKKPRSRFDPAEEALNRFGRCGAVLLRRLLGGGLAVYRGPHASLGSHLDQGVQAE